MLELVASLKPMRILIFQYKNIWDDILFSLYKMYIGTIFLTTKLKCLKNHRKYYNH